MPDIDSTFPNVSRFFTAYFHQDWDLDGLSLAENVRQFVWSFNQEIVLNIIVELRLLISNYGEESKMRHALSELGCYCNFQKQPHEYRKWVEEVLGMIGVELRSRYGDEVYEKSKLN
jgi:CdiI immunity protein